MIRLDGKVAVITGAASGIGAATARLLARLGASVLLADLDETGAAMVAEEIRTDNGHASGHGADVADESSVIEMIRRASAEFGHLDILCNNAAATGPDTLGRDNELDVMGMDVDLWDRTMAVNLRGVMLGCKHALPCMLERGGGSIVNTSSSSSLTGDLVRSAYAASKAGVNALTLYVATMYGKDGIRCNAIAPGLIQSRRHSDDSSSEIRIYEQNHLTPELGRPQDIAQLVAFLTSDESRFITGQIVRADGGLLSHMPRFAQDMFGDA